MLCLFATLPDVVLWGKNMGSPKMRKHFWGIFLGVPAKAFLASYFRLSVVLPKNLLWGVLSRGPRKISSR